MTTIAVNVHRKEAADTGLLADLERARALARLLDAEFDLGGIKFGLDAIVGFVPVVGDTISLLAGAYPILLARKHKLGKRVQMRMLANLGIDYIVGMVPIVGDLFDIAFKANLKNLALFEQAARKAR